MSKSRNCECHEDDTPDLGGELLEFVLTGGLSVLWNNK